MRHFTDATTLLAAPVQLRMQFQREGYLFFRGLLARDAALELRSAILECCRAAGWLRTSADPLEARVNPERACADPQPAFLAVYHKIQCLEAFHAFAHQPPLLRLVETVLGEPALPHPNKLARLIFPQDPAFTTPAHQDFPFVQGTPETYTTWIPLGDYPLPYGGLKVNVGSHRNGVHDLYPQIGSSGLGIRAKDLSGSWLTADYRAGDVVLFHSHTVHQALPNTTEDLRVSVDFRYQAASQPIAGASLLPPTYGQLTWDDIYRDWTCTDLQYYWLAFSPVIEEYDLSYRERAQAEVLRAAARGDPVARVPLQRIVNQEVLDRARRERARLALDQLDRLLAAGNTQPT